MTRPHPLVPRPLRPCFRPNGDPKRRYEKKQDAIEQALRQGGSKRRPYRAYECPVCAGWHVGRKPPKGKRGRR